MSEYQITYWRELPSLVVAREGDASAEDPARPALPGGDRRGCDAARRRLERRLPRGVAAGRVDRGRGGASELAAQVVARLEEEWSAEAIDGVPGGAGVGAVKGRVAARERCTGGDPEHARRVAGASPEARCGSGRDPGNAVAGFRRRSQHRDAAASSRAGGSVRRRATRRIPAPSVRHTRQCLNGDGRPVYDSGPERTNATRRARTRSARVELLTSRARPMTSAGPALRIVPRVPSGEYASTSSTAQRMYARSAARNAARRAARRRRRAHEAVRKRSPRSLMSPLPACRCSTLPWSP